MQEPTSTTQTTTTDSFVSSMTWSERLKKRKVRLAQKAARKANR
jgi:hypothetical protein